jgi:ribosomal protein S18 acetylase RimI-like enzyme
MNNLDTMQFSDISAGLALCRKSGWNQLSRDWEYFLKYSPNDCLVARSNDEVVGTVACLRFQRAFSWISMVLVDPAIRGRGIGTFLLEQALRLLEQEETIKLDATPEGRKVYVKFDFRDEYPLTRMIC